MRTTIACLVLGCGLGFLSPAYSQFISTSGNEIRAIAIDPVNHATVYVGTDQGQIFKSTDGGASWSASSSRLTNWRISTLAINPAETSTVYAGSDGEGVYKTTDAGESWNRVDSGFKSPQVMSIVIDPSNPETVYAGTFGGWIFKTMNGGTSWSAFRLGFVTTWVQALAIDERNTSTIYAATWGDNHHVRTYGVFKSIDGGHTWDPINSRFPATKAIFSMAMDPSTPDTIYLGTRFPGGLYKSTDGGQQWLLVENIPNLQPSSILVLAVDPANSSKLFVGFGFSLDSSGGVAISNDGGESWDASPSRIGKVFSLAIDPVEASTIYAGTVMGVFKSMDGGTSWQSVGPFQSER